MQPETLNVPPTPHSPNSFLPVIIYRRALHDSSPLAILEAIEPNGWRKGGQWKTYNVSHFHSNTHECYGVIRGSSVYLLGKSPIDPDFDEHGHPVGVKFVANAGDVFVLPVCFTFVSDSTGAELTVLLGRYIPLLNRIRRRLRVYRLISIGGMNLFRLAISITSIPCASYDVTSYNSMLTPFRPDTTRKDHRNLT